MRIRVFRFVFCLSLSVVLLGLSRPAHAAELHSGINYCVKATTDSGGYVVFTNTCDFKIHLTWASGNERWDNYLAPGDDHDTGNNFGGRPYSWYACHYNEWAVDTYGHPISREVSNFLCKSN